MDSGKGYDSVSTLFKTDVTGIGSNVSAVTQIVTELNRSMVKAISDVDTDCSGIRELINIVDKTLKPPHCNSKGTQTEDSSLTTNEACQFSSNLQACNDKAESDLCCLCPYFKELDRLVSVYDESSGKNGLEEKINSTVPIKGNVTNGFARQICDTCFQKFTIFQKGCNTFVNGNKKQQNVVCDETVLQDIKGGIITASQESCNDTAENRSTPSCPGQDINQVLTQPSRPQVNQEDLPRLVKKRGRRPRRVLDDSQDLSLLDPDHGSGLQVEWLLVNSNPPRRKFTCKRTRKEKSSSQIKGTVDKHTPEQVGNQLEYSDEFENSPEKLESNPEKLESTVFQCTSCPLSFATKSEAFLHKLTKHSKEIPGVYIHNDKKTKPATVLTEQRNSLGSYQEDIVNVSPAKPTEEKEDEEDQNMCDLCMLPFNSPYMLLSHKCEAHNYKKLNKPNPCKLPKIERLSKQDTKASDELFISESKDNNETGSLLLKKCPFCSFKIPNQCDIDAHCEEVHARYMCVLCEGVFYDKAEYKAHMKSHGIKSREVNVYQTESPEIHTGKTSNSEVSYDCKVCNKKFTQHNLFLSHQRLHVKQEEYECDTCGMSFRDKILFANHMQTHIRVCPFECDICERKFYTSESLKEHQQDHIENKHICAVCGDVFLSAKGLEMHTQEAHRNRLPYICRVCGKRYPNEVSLRAHKSIHKRKRGDHVCNVCGKDFFLESNLTRHMVIHPGKLPYKCLLCFKAFKEASMLLKHKAIHHFDKSFICKLCISYFSSLSALQKHRFEDHSSKEITDARRKREGTTLQSSINVLGHQCEVCDKVLRTKQNLRNHMVLHNPERPFRCQICRRFYASQTHLTQHMRYHTGESPFQCNACEKSFRNSKTLAQHMVIHTNERKFACNYCNKTFRWNQSLTTHIASHGEKRFRCPTCNRPYQHKNSMLKHFRSNVCQPNEWVDVLPLKKKILNNPTENENRNQSWSSSINGSVHLMGNNSSGTNDMKEVEYDIVMD